MAKFLIAVARSTRQLVEARFKKVLTPPYRQFLFQLWTTDTGIW
ncbi:MAG TPA: hypothetical protein V6C85_10170 [Allocoleopsis sp.]